MASFPKLPQFVYFAYQTDLTDADGNSYTSQVKCLIDPTLLSIADVDNVPPEDTPNSIGSISSYKKRRNLRPRFVSLSVTPTGASKATLVKIPILTRLVAAQLLTLGLASMSGDITYAGFDGNIVLEAYQGEFYFRVFNQVEVGGEG